VRNRGVHHRSPIASERRDPPAAEDRRADSLSRPYRPARERLAARPAQQLQRANAGEGLVTERLEISFTPAEGAVLRMLGLVERRGFLVRGIAMSEQLDTAKIAIDVEPRDPGRD